MEVSFLAITRMHSIDREHQARAMHFDSNTVMRDAEI